MLPNTEPLRGSKVTPVSEKGQGKGRLKKGHGSWAVGFEFEIILQCGCQYDSYVTFQLEVLTGYFWINFDCVFYFCAKCSICLKEMNFSAEWIHDCSRWIIYYQPTELQDSFIHKLTKKCLVAFLYWKSELLPILPRMTCSQNVLKTSRFLTKTTCPVRNYRRSQNVQWTWQFTNRPIRHPSFFLTRTTWKGTNEKKHAIVHLKIGLCLTGPTNSYWTHSLTRCWLALCPNEMV